VDSVTAAPPVKTVYWLILVGVLAVVSYAGRLTAGPPDRDVLYQYGSAVAAVIQYGILLAVLLLIGRGLDLRELLAWRRPRSWPGATGFALVALATIYLTAGVVDVFLDPAEEQGLTPERWEPDRAGAYAANFVAVALLAPVVEELVYRGAGVSLLLRFGRGAAIVVTAAAFAAAHGLLEAFPILFVFGLALAWLRLRTESIIPCVAVHALFNAAALVAAVTLEAS
jgi:membrane protease YdiL (CAAX protease family)